MTFGLRIADPAEFGLNDAEYWRTLNIKDVQSITFTCEILPTIWDLYADFSGKLTLLDVGTRTGAGTAIIGYLHQLYSLNRIKIETTAVDIDATYVEYARKHYPFANFKKGDIFKIDSDSYDVVLCSHTIEHVDDPVGFLAQLKRIARQYVILACPFGEKELISGHRNRFDQSFFSETGAQALRVYRSVTWHQSLACVATYDVRNAGVESI